MIMMNKKLTLTLLIFYHFFHSLTKMDTFLYQRKKYDAKPHTVSTVCDNNYFFVAVDAANTFGVSVIVSDGVHGYHLSCTLKVVHCM